MPTSDLLAVPGAIRQADLEREALWTRAQAYYDGTMPNQLEVKPGGVDHNIKLNYARLVVNKGRAFLVGKPGFGFAIEGDSAKRTAVKQKAFLDALWRVNQARILPGKIVTNGGIYGTPFVRIMKDDRFETPRFVNLDPTNMEVELDDADVDVPLSYTYTWTAIDESAGRAYLRRLVFQPDGDPLAATGWVIEESDTRDSSEFMIVREEAWPFPFSPIAHCQNLPRSNEFWGEPDLTADLLDLNDDVNRALSTITKVLHYHGFPLTIGQGFSADQIARVVDGMLLIANKDAKVYNLEMQGDLSSALDLYARVKEALHEQARIPEVAMGKLETAGAMSGVALDILYEPLVELTEDKQAGYGALFSELNRRAFLVAGQGDVVVNPTWPQVVPKDPESERRTLVLDHDLGASRQTLLEKAGYDPVAEAKLRAAEDAAAAELARAAFDAGDAGGEFGNAGGRAVDDGDPAE